MGRMLKKKNNIIQVKKGACQAVNKCFVWLVNINGLGPFSIYGWARSPPKWEDIVLPLA